MPEKISIDKSGSNKAAIVSIQADSGFAIAMRQSKYLNNIVEQDYRAIKRVTRPMLGLKTFRCARIIIGGIETMHMIRKNQLGDIKDQAFCSEPVLRTGILIEGPLSNALGLIAVSRQNR